MRYRFLMRALDAPRKRNPGDGFIPHGVTGNCLILGNVARRHAMDRARFGHRLGTEIETTIAGCNKRMVRIESRTPDAQFRKTSDLSVPF
jgi:hypothetical protein